MKKLFLFCSFITLTLAACSRTNDTLTNKTSNLYRNVPASSIPPELARGLWFSGTLSAISYFDRDGHKLGNDYEAGREYQFYHENGKGRIKFRQYLGTRNYSNCVTEIYTRKEGSVAFDGNKFTFYPVQGSFKTIKRGCSKNAITERKAEGDDLKPVIFRWDIRDIDGKPHLYTFDEKDLNRENPLFVYSFAQ